MTENIIDATANMTLADIRARDIDNLTLVYQNAKRFDFETDQIAKVFIANCKIRALSKFGIDGQKIAKECNLNLEAYRKEVDRQCAEKNIVVEKRNRSGDHKWRSGIYIYHRNEIAYFISFPFPVPYKKYADSHIIVPGEFKYRIVTNVA
jgi:hypothetical protein